MNAGLLRRVALSLAAPVSALVIAVVASSIVLVIADSNPIQAFSDMAAQASRLETMVDILNRATPLYISGIAASIGFRMNLFNIGVEGQYLLAALVAAQVGSLIDVWGPIHVSIILLTAMAVGAAYAGIAGFLKVTRGVNEVISTIMLNAIAISGLVAALVRAWQAGGGVDATAGNQGIGTDLIPDSGRIPSLNGFFELFTRDIGLGKEVTGVLAIAIVVGIGYHLLVNRSRFGFDLRASGFNPFAARAGGVEPRRMIFLAMVLSGAVAGLVGIAGISDVGRFNPNFVRGLGFAGIGVALLGRNHPGGVAIAALIFAFLDVSSGVLQISGNAPREIVQILQGVIILAAVVAYEVVERYRSRAEAKDAAAALQAQADDPEAAIA